MDDGAQSPRGVQRVVALDAVAGEHGEHNPDEGFAGAGEVVLAGPGGAHRGGIEAGPLPGELPVGMGEGEERGVARLADSGLLDAGGGFAQALQREAAMDRLETVDMLVERGRADAEISRRCGRG